MKQTASTLMLFFILLFAYTKLAGPIPFSLNSVVSTKTDFFTVNGEGKVEVSPDIAVVNVGVTAQGATVKAVQQELNTKINAVTSAIKGLGVDAKDIKNANYNINPSYDYQSGTQKITGYQANTNLIVKVRDLDKVNGVIDGATASGANEVGGISFDVDDKSKAENQAREQAVADAKKKAESAAKIAGFTLGRVINYQESFGGGVRPMPMYDKAVATMEASGAPTQIEPGSSEVVVQVTLTYQLN